MPTSAIKELMLRVRSLEEKIAVSEKQLATIHADLVWVTRIIVGAAGLGFLEKAVGWWIR